MRSQMDDATKALWKVREPPTARGSFSMLAPTPPNSKAATRFGAWVRLASAAASMGIPVPMKHIVLSSICLAAVQMSSSVGL